MRDAAARAVVGCCGAAVAFVCPFVLYTLCQRFVTPITEMLGLINSFYVWGGLILLCLVWFAVFALVFINRAHCL